MKRMTDDEIRGSVGMFHSCTSRHQLSPEIYGLDWKVYNFKHYPVMYHRYMGIGHHLYVFVKDNTQEAKINEVCDQKVNPRQMMPQLAGIDCRVVMVDVEMGGMSVWLSEKYNGSDNN
jgi:hypothetical protein